MKTLISLTFISAIMFITGCSSDNDPAQSIEQSATPLNQVALKPVQDCPALKDKLVDNWVENLLVNRRYTPGQFNDFEVSVPQNDSLASPNSGSADSAPDDISQTNTQEAGVDETDRIKVDSQGNLYIAQQNKLIIANAWPAQSMDILSSLDLEGYVSGLYLAEADKRVIALVRPRTLVTPALVDSLSIPYFWKNPELHLVFIDISDPADPVVRRKARLAGNLVSSRNSNGRIHVVQSYHLDNFVSVLDQEINTLLVQYHQAFNQDDADSMADIESKLKQYITQQLNSLDVSALLPESQVSEGNHDLPAQTLSCDNVYAPVIDTRHNQLLIVSSIDIDGTDLQRAAALGSGWIVYASQQDLFIVQSGHSWWWRPHQKQQSAIHHFSISDQSPVYVSTGLVKGYINNSFSLSYYQDHLRVATTEFNWGLNDGSDITSTNHLFVLKDNRDNTMDITGSVEHYADNERIFSARFIKDRAYVVTFRQIDPLFSFDLSDPTDPQIAGELKIPGFSNYIHPIDDSHLLTIGRDGDAVGAGNQIAIKLFDVTNLSQPVLIDSYSPEMKNGYSWSAANWDHHAFTYFEPAGLLSVPLSTYDSGNDEYFMGLLALNVDTATGLSLAGTVDHQDLASQINCASSSLNCKYYYRWLSQPVRSIFMTESSDTYLYSLSNIGLKAINTNDFDTTVGSLLLPTTEDFYWLYY